MAGLSGRSRLGDRCHAGPFDREGEGEREGDADRDGGPSPWKVDARLPLSGPSRDDRAGDALRAFRAASSTRAD